MRKLTLTALAAAFALAGCGGNGDEDTIPNDTGAATTDIEPTGTVGTETGDDSGGETETDDD